MYLNLEKQNRFSSRLKQTMLAKPQALMDLHVKNSEVIMSFRVSSGNELQDFFEEKWEMLKSKKIVGIQVLNLKSFSCDSKRNNRVKLNTNKAIAFSHSLLLFIRVTLI